jgi:hypothetical protein
LGLAHLLLVAPLLMLCLMLLLPQQRRRWRHWQLQPWLCSACLPPAHRQGELKGRQQQH